MSHVSYYHPGVQNCKALPVYVTNASSIGGGGGGTSGIELTGYTTLCDSANPGVYYLAWRSVNEDGTGTVQRYLTMPAGTETAGPLPVTATVCGDSSQVIEECFVDKLVIPDNYYKKLIVMNGATVSAVIVIDQQTNAVVGSLPAGAIPCQTVAEQLESVALCDDVNGDGSLIVPFVRVVSVNADTGGVTNVGDYTAAYSRASQTSNQAISVSNSFANAGTQLVVTIPSAGTWWIRYKATFTMTHVSDGPVFSLSTIVSGTVTGLVTATRAYHLKQTGQGGDLDDNSSATVHGSARVTTTGSEQFRVLVASTNWNTLNITSAGSGLGESFIEYEQAI